MYCEQCGAKLSSHAKFCPECGCPTGGQDASDERTRVIGREASGTDDLPKTTRMPRAEAGTTQATTVRRQAANRTTPAQPPRKRSVVPIVIAVAAIALVLAALFAVATCSKGGTPAKQDEPQTTVTDTTQDAADGQTDTQDGQNSTDQQGDDSQQPDQTPENTHAGGPTDVDQATLDTWQSKARSFLNIYPVNHIQAGGADDDPVQMDLDTWAGNCLMYVDQSCDLGQALLNDPESVAAPLGYYEAAQFVAGTQVVSADGMGVVVDVTIEGTQVDWDNTVTYTQRYLVQFDDDDQIVNVVDIEA